MKKYCPREDKYMYRKISKKLGDRVVAIYIFESIFQLYFRKVMAPSSQYVIGVGRNEN